MRQGFPVTVAELLVSGGRPLPAEAAAIVLGVCSRVTAGTRHVVAAPITTSSVFVEADGSVSVAGGAVVEDEQTVSLLGHLLLAMLRPRGPSPQRPAARLEALALRASAVSDPAGLTFARFVSELRRFAPEDDSGAVRGLFDRWRAGGREAGPRDGRVPDTIRRLLPEADLAAMAGLTPTLHGTGARAGFFRAGRRLVLTGATVALLMAAGATYLLWGGEKGPEPPAPRPGRSNARVVQPSPARELLPGGAAAARPAPAQQDQAKPGADRPGAKPRSRRLPAGPN